ncbi:MAG: 16S rRNA (cytosine(967)-C(5))-methyltransferase RsmB [Lachnospiraceae bacterium]|nr:16S rRNA (cytosine(967)-C(5))-methyltransferase RsmB [Lachnospiraceae bacterium]
MAKDAEKNLRNIVCTMLVETLEKGGFSHIVVNDTFSSNDLDGQERAFVTRLFTGVLERLILIDSIINAYSKTNTQKMKPVIRNILRLSVYQLFYMDSVPDHAAINEAVLLAKKKGFGGLTGFVNGVLRNIQRNGIPENLPENVRCCTPKWFYEKMVQQEGKEAAEGFFYACLESGKNVSVRLNLRKESKENIVKSLIADGCKVEKDPEIKEAVYISGFEKLTELNAYKNGLIFIQDTSSMNIGVEAGNALSEKTPKLIIDVCAAPGGKSTHLAEKYPEARIISRDLTPEKTKLIEENRTRLGLSNVECQVWDALSLDETLVEKADLVVADLPCSGLGVIGNKPDIKWRVKEKDLKELEQLQKNILTVVQSYVKPDGILIYSTCTVNQGENSDNVQWFTENYPFELQKEKKFLPGRDNSDGFYIAVLKRK